MNTLKLMTIALAMVSTTAATAVPLPQERPAQEACTLYLDDAYKGIFGKDAEHKYDYIYKCTNQPGAPQITCDEDHVAIMFVDRKYHCAWPSEMWIELTPEERGAFDPDAGPSEE